jgi:hypothetical protein
MAFVVEDGTGLTNSNSYLSVADADALLEQDPNRESWKSWSAQQREICLRFATSYLDTKYRWYGNVYNPSAPQALQWPRTINYDDKGVEIPAGTIPAQLKRAAVFIALEMAKASSLASGSEDLTASVEASGAIKSFQIETLAITFDQGSAKDGGGILREFLGKRYPQVELILHSIGELQGQLDLAENL